LDDQVELATLARQFEEVHRPGSTEPVRLRRGSHALYLLHQAGPGRGPPLRVTFHGETRGKRMTKSVLDGIPGLGPARRTRLVKELGGVNAVRSAPLEELMGLSWLPEQVAIAVYQGVRKTGAR
jgi:excinuclease ABC subunit C